MSTWVKVYNGLPAHPKIIAAGDRAGWLFVCGLCYSNEHLTDGYIPRAVLPVAAPGVKFPERLAAKLVEVGLWHDLGDGWQIHEYTETQRGAAEVKAKRKADAKRQAERRASTASSEGVAQDTDATRAGVRRESARLDVEVEGREEGRDKLASSRLKVGS